MTRAVKSFRLMTVAILLISCSNSTNPTRVVKAYDFSKGQQRWIAGFTDYPVGAEKQYELSDAYLPLLPPLDVNKQALHISGNNHSDDLFMYYRVKVDGLDANAAYRARFDVEIATSVPHGCMGVGGAPGESVWVKAGASTTEPVPVVESGTYRLSVDKGEQSNGGESAVVLGNVANSHPCSDSAPWELKRLRDETASVLVRSDARGSLWLFAGTDSGFEATTSIFYVSFEATLHRE